MTTKRNRLITFIVGLYISFYFLAGSIFLLINDSNINLSNSKNVIGEVIYTDTRQIEDINIRWTSYSRVFYFKLNNSDQKFAVHNSYEGYDNLQRAIKVGDTIKVYYGSTLLDNYNRHVFQIEKHGKILIDYPDYNKSASEKAGLGLFIGIVVLTGYIMWFKRFNILKFLDSLVNDKENQ